MKVVFDTEALAEYLAWQREDLKVLEKLNGHIDADAIRRMNAEVGMHHRDPRKVAERWLQEEGLL